MAKKKFYRPLLYWLLVATKSLFSLFPFRVGFTVAGFVGKFSFYALPKERKKTLSHLKMAFGDEKTNKELRTIGAKVFENYGHVAAELNLIDKLLPRLDRIIRITGREHIDRALAKGKGVSAVGAHFGNWELMAGYLAFMGYRNASLARRIYYDKYNDMLMSIRAKLKLKTIDRESPTAAREAFKVFRDNGVVGFVADQDVETIDGVFVDFFGRPAFSPAAPVRFAMKTGASLIALFMVREGMKHHMIIEPPIELTLSGDDEKDIVANTQKWVSLQEKYIRQYPWLWAWNHKRWKTRQILQKTAC